MELLHQAWVFQCDAPDCPRMILAFDAKMSAVRQTLRAAGWQFSADYIINCPDHHDVAPRYWDEMEKLSYLEVTRIAANHARKNVDWAALPERIAPAELALFAQHAAEDV